MALVDWSLIDTHPGRSHPMAPPAGFSGNDEEYANYIRQRLRDEFDFRLAFVVGARYLSRIDVKASGPYSRKALDLLHQL